MIFPFGSLVAENREFGLVVAVLLGFFFGVCLERAGFGRATKLAGQFYLHDMTVFKVMFSAIVTAMLGAVVVSSLGLADLRLLSESVVSTTYIWPMLVGGLLLGVGFIVSGYCPGTSAVATASGHIDGLFTFAGVIVGSMIYSEFYPLVAEFHNSGDLGQLFLYDLVGAPPAVVAAGVVAMAVGCFFVVDRVERVFIEKRTGQEPESVSVVPRHVAMGVYGAAAAIALAALLLPASQATAREKKHGLITAEALARRTLDRPWTIRILDIRDREQCAAARVPGAECVPSDELRDLGLQYSPPTRNLVIVASRDVRAIPEPAARYRGQVLVLAGGFEAWRTFVLKRPEPPGAEATDVQRDQYRFRAAYHQMLTGVKQAPPPARPAATYVPKKKKKGGGCDG